MREIKFRAWDKKDERMKTGVESYIGSYLPPNGSIHETHILMQFTGLKDKNGKEIFEGDIVKGDWDVVNKMYVSAVDFRDGNFSIEKTGLPLSYGYAGKECEVIGNIYENPELLTLRD